MELTIPTTWEAVSLKPEYTSILNFESKVFELEDIRIIIRAPEDSKVLKYYYSKRSSEDKSISDFINTRIKPLIGNFNVVVISGNGMATQHPRTKMKTIRNSYNLT